MYVNATHALLCNNYGNSLILLHQTCLPQLLSKNPASPPCPWKGCRHWSQPPATLSPARLLSSSPPLPSSTDSPQTHTPLDHIGNSHLQTYKITSPCWHLGPNWHVKGHCNSTVFQVYLLSRPQKAHFLSSPPGPRSSESELPPCQLT